MEAANVAEKHLELKEQSEKGRLCGVKENHNLKNVDFFSALAIAGVVLVLIFESYFVLELYRGKSSPIATAVPVPAETNTPPVEVETSDLPEAVETNSPAAVETSVPAVEDTKPVAPKKIAPVG